MFYKTFIFALLAVGAIAVKLELSDKVRESFKSKLTAVCNKAGGDAQQKAEQLTNSVQSFIDCIYPIIDVDSLKDEIAAAKANKTLDEVFKKYCAKTSEIETCLHTLIDGASPCVVESAKNQLNMAKNGTDLLIDYVCYKDGDRITQFLTENGPECVQSKTKEINICAETLSTQVSSLENGLSLTVEEKCGKLDDLSTCIVKALETCPTPTPGNLLESLFRYVRNGSLCNNALPLPVLAHKL